MAHPLSMTGYGIASMRSQAAVLQAELRSSNGRYLDLNLRLPRVYNVFEQDLRELLAKHFERGRIELAIVRTAQRESAVAVEFNRAALRELSRMYTKVGRELRCPDSFVRETLLRDALGRREVLNLVEQPTNVRPEYPLLIKVVTAAVKASTKMRSVEGVRLWRDISKRLDHVSGLRQKIAKRASGRPQEIRERIRASVRRLAPDVAIDPGRLAAEVAVLADKADIAEEIVRLGSHDKQFRSQGTQRTVGKRLDFLVQEIMRELNTIGSKAQDAEIQGFVVNAKTEIERIREQVQNLE